MNIVEILCDVYRSLPHLSLTTVRLSPTWRELAYNMPYMLPEGILPSL
jgi:hypothetical protein